MTETKSETTNKIFNLNREVKPEESADALNLAAFMEPSYSEKKGTAPEPLDMSVAEAQNAEQMSINEEAQRVWESGNALEYIVNECHKKHVGDDIIIRACILSYAETKALNGSGIHIEVGGKSGAGKSHVTKTAGDMIPLDHYLSGQFTDMAIFYIRNILPGTVIRMDDQSTSKPVQETMKARTSVWLEEFQKHTVKPDRSGSDLLKIPPRCPHWMSIKDSPSDDQVLDRELILHVDESPEQLKRIEDIDNWRDMHPKDAADHRGRDVCRGILSMLPEVYVDIPFANRIECVDSESTRTKTMTKSLIKASAIIHAPKRNRKEEDLIVATEEDFKIAVGIMNPILMDIGGSQKHHFTPVQSKIIKYLLERGTGTYTNRELQINLVLADYEVTRAINGIREDHSDGLEKIPGIIKGKVPGSLVGSELRELMGIEFIKETYTKWDGSKGCVTLRDPDEE